MSHYLIRQIEATPNVSVRPRTEIVDGGGDGWLEYLRLRDRSVDREETVDAGGLFIMIGANPRTDWLPAELQRDAEGFLITGPDLAPDPAGPSSAVPTCSRRVCPASSPSATFGTAPEDGSLPQWGRVRSPSSCCTSSSPPSSYSRGAVRASR